MWAEMMNNQAWELGFIMSISRGDERQKDKGGIKLAIKFVMVSFYFCTIKLHICSRLFCHCQFSVVQPIMQKKYT